MTLPDSKTIIVVAAAAAVVVAAFIYVRAKKQGPSRSLWTGGVTKKAAAQIEDRPTARRGRLHW